MKQLYFYCVIIFSLIFFLSAFKNPLNNNGCRKKKQSLQDYFKWTPNRTYPIIMGHRMAPIAGYADNGFKTLVYTQQTAPCVIQEMDVRMSKDSVLLMLHDPTLDRTTTGKGKLNNFTSNEINKLELKDIYGTVLKGQHIPTLSKVLRFVKKNKMVVALDMKPGTDPTRLMKEVIESKTLPNVIVICYTLTEAIALNKKHPELMLALGFNSWENIKNIEQSGLPYQNLIALTPSELQDKFFYDKIHSMGIMVSFSAQGSVDVNYSNKKTSYKEVFERGGDIICTDSLKNAISVF